MEFLGLSVPVEALGLLVLEAVLGAALVVAFVLAALRKGAAHHWTMLTAFAIDVLVANR